MTATPQSRAVLEAWFETGDIPDGSNFSDLIYSFGLVNENYLVFSTVALMKVATTPTDGQLVATRGYHAAYDGGANLYWYRKTGRAGVTLDDGFFLTAAGADDYFEAIDRQVANIRKFGAKADGSDDSAAIQAAFDSVAPTVYAPEGTYYIATPIDFDVAGAEVPYRMKGDGVKKTFFKPHSTFTATNWMFRTINGSLSEYLAYSTFEDFWIWAQKDDLTNVAGAFDADACIHSTFRNLRLSYATEAIFSIGRSFTNTWEDCLFSDSDKFCFRAIDGVFNQNSFRRSTFIRATKAGFYARAGFENSFVACGFENCDNFGVFLNRMRGCEFTGCYFEGSGDTKHNFTTVNGAPPDGSAWSCSGAVCLCGVASPPTDDLPTDCGTSEPCNGITFNGSLWTPNPSDSDVEFVTLAGCERVSINFLGYGANYDPAAHTLVNLYGAHNLADHFHFNDAPLTDTSPGNDLKIEVQENPSVHDSDPGDWKSANHRYSWVNSQPVTEINLTDFQLLSGDGTWSYSGRKFRGWPMFWLTHTASPSGYVGSATAWSLEKHPELAGKRCVCEVYFYPVCDRLSAGSSFWASGLQVRVASEHGFITNQDGAGAVDENSIQTTGSITLNTNSLTVASADGLTVGAPIVIAGAGTPTDHTTFITAISGTTVTLEDNADVTVSNAVVIQPVMHYSRVIFYPDPDVTWQDIRIRKIAGDNSQRMLIAKVIVREIGSEAAVIPYYDDPELRLEGEVIPYTTLVSGDTGDGKLYLRVPLEAADMRLTYAAIAHGAVVASSGTTTVTLTKLQAAGSGGSRTEYAMLTTPLTIDANEWDSKDAATPAVIATGSDAEVNHGAIIRVDVDAAGANAQGLYITLGFRKVDP